MTSISELLAERGASLDLHHRGDPEQAQQHAKLSRLLMDNIHAWHIIRNQLFHAQHVHHAYHGMNQPWVKKLTHQLEKMGYITLEDGCWQLSANCSKEDEQYFRGHWLEEYAYLAYVEAGCDQLSLASCKCLNPRSADLDDKLKEFIAELVMMDAQFAALDAKAILLTTADLYEGHRNQLHRYPALEARCALLDVDLLGLEDLAWRNLVASIDEHWKT